MVLSYNPQLAKKSLITNSNYPPQGSGGANVIPPTGDEMLYEDGIVMEFEDGGIMEYE